MKKIQSLLLMAMLMAFQTLGASQSGTLFEADKADMKNIALWNDTYFQAYEIVFLDPTQITWKTPLPKNGEKFSSSEHGTVPDLYAEITMHGVIMEYKSGGFDLNGYRHYKFVEGKGIVDD
ncbi:MAG: hypothetical protein WC360_01700 [Opitutales bacterium]|jgi:hypothetical protein